MKINNQLVKIKNKYKKLIAVVLTVSIIVTSFTSVVQTSAQTEESAFNKAAQVIAAEDENVQTASRPAEITYEFVISGEDDFASFMTTPVFWRSNHKVTLACDIDMRGKAFNPIKEFGGVFDGRGHTVSNLKIQNKSGKGKNVELAFINTLNEYAEIKNVNFDNYTIEGKSDIKKAAGLIVINHGTISSVYIVNGGINNIAKKVKAAGYVLNNEEEGIIENCHIENMSDKEAMIKSGFVGTNLGKITKCSTTVSVNSKDIAGGFCVSNSGEINDCKADGAVKASAKKGMTICGGFIAENSGIIKNSSSTGEVKGQEFTGGFAGINNDKGEISSCKATCDVKSHTYVASIYCGGFVGLDAGKIEGSTFDGTVDGCVDSEKVVGGVIGLVVGVTFIISFSVILYFASLDIKYLERLRNRFLLDNIQLAFNTNTGEDPFNEIDMLTNALNDHYENRYIIRSLSTEINRCIIPLIAALIVAFICGFTSGVTARFAAGRKCANVAGFCGVNAGEISRCSANNSSLTAKSMYNKQNMCGGFAGINGETGTIKDCSATGNEIDNKTYTGGHLGGFVGENSGKIDNGTTNISVANGKCTGGFCGNNSGEISGSRSEGNATANAKTVKTKCGGFIGENDKQGKISNCISTGSATGEEYVGGFAGVNKSEIIDCNAHGKATAKTKTHTALAGGFVGENDKGTIISCTATGGADSRSSSGQAKSGGFVGINKASIMSSKASGNVYLSAGTFYKDDGCGGFVGKNNQGGNIDGCYVEATVETTNKKKGGGFVGEAKSKSTIKNSQSKAKIVTKSGTKSNTKFCENKDKKAVIAN